MGPASRRRVMRAVALTVAVAGTACSLVYGISDNVGPLPSVSPGDGGPDGTPDGGVADAGLDTGTDARPDVQGEAGDGATNWCATQAGPHFFCEDFDESSSATPDGFVAVCGSPALASDPTCGSPPRCLLAANGGCVAIAKTFAVQTGKATVSLWMRLDAHDAGALNKVVDLMINAPAAGGTPYVVGMTLQAHMNLFYIATNGAAGFVNALPTATGEVFNLSFTVDLAAATLDGTFNGVPASLPLGAPMPTPAQVQSITLYLGIPDSTAAAGETVHVDDVTFDPQ